MIDKFKLPTEPYKGVRDFYPPDMFVQNYIFDTYRKVVESFGYVEYSASVLEPSELYRRKGSDEIVNEQTYTFTDRGQREVTLRPEMTPTVARMVARTKRDLSLPARWYSIPNLFRYEKPQRGRLREHWQLNVDIFGVKGVEAEAEVITIAEEIMRKLGVKPNQFETVINNRKITESLFSYFEFSESERRAARKFIDKKDKIAPDEFKLGLADLAGSKNNDLLKALEVDSVERLDKEIFKADKGQEGIKEIKELLATLKEDGMVNIRYSPTLVRGFDYYTGIVFEVFDTGEKNRRSLLGGGRYDSLLDIFGSEKITSVGFGMGDVTIRDFLETHNLLPQYRPTIDLYLCRVDNSHQRETDNFAKRLREKGLRVSVDLSDRKISDQIRAADKQAIPFIICIGEDETKTRKFKVKNLKTREEVLLAEDEIPEFVKSSSQTAR